MVKSASEMVYKAQVNYAHWVVNLVANNLGCDFEGMLTVLRTKHAEKK